MALLRKATQRIEFGEDWVDVRMPSFGVLARAKDRKLRQSLNLVKEIGITESRDLAATSAETPKGDADPRDGYDEVTVLEGCIVDWSDDDAVTPENIALLDPSHVDTILAVLLPRHTQEDRKS